MEIGGFLNSGTDPQAGGSGHLFQGRFKSNLVDEGSWPEVIRLRSTPPGHPPACPFSP